MNKGFWMTKGPGHENDANSTFDGPSLLDSKRAHHWFVDGCETQVFPNKKQAIQVPNSKMTGGLANVNVLPWEQHSANYQSVSHQLIGRIFGPESVRSADFDLTKASPVISDSLDLRRKCIEDQYGEEASVGLSISHGMEDPETSLSYGGIRKVKINQVKDNLHGLQASLRNDSCREDGDQLAIEGYYKEIETGLVSVGSAYIKEDDSFSLMNQTSNDEDHHIRFLGPGGKVDDNVVSICDDYGKRDANIISFGGYPDEQDIISLGRSLGSHDPTFFDSSFQASEAPGVTELESSHFDVAVAVSSNQIVKQKPDTMLKSRPEYKMKKEAPNSFPSNVRSLITTGMLDGVPVKYVSVAREELRGIINGSGYLCGCQSCNFSKMLNAYEFERHAGCKTKHPNNHIYFENGKTIYQIVQELRSTPESLLFDTIQTIFGAPINQKSFRSWKAKHKFFLLIFSGDISRATPAPLYHTHKNTLRIEIVAEGGYVCAFYT